MLPLCDSFGENAVPPSTCSGNFLPKKTCLIMWRSGSEVGLPKSYPPPILLEATGRILRGQPDAAFVAQLKRTTLRSTTPAAGGLHLG